MTVEALEKLLDEIDKDYNKKKIECKELKCDIVIKKNTKKNLEESYVKNVSG